jgi:hypothetical protein
MGFSYFLQPDSRWTQETPEVISFWEQGKDPQIARRIGIEVGDSDPCKYLGRVMDSYGLKREGDGKITLPNGQRARQYRLKPLDPICQAIYDCVEAKVLAAVDEDETVLDWAGIIEKTPSTEDEPQSQQGVEAVHNPPSESINHQGVCGQVTGHHSELEQLIEALPFCETPEDFAAVVEDSPLEMVEDAIALQPDQPRRRQLTQWLESLNQPVGEVEPQPLKARSWEWSELPLVKSVLRWIDRSERVSLLSVEADGRCQVRSLFSNLITNTRLDQLMPI